MDIIRTNIFFMFNFVDEDVQWGLYNGEAASSRGHLLPEANRPQQTCAAIFILYPLKHTVMLTQTVKWTCYQSSWLVDCCWPYRVCSDGLQGSGKTMSLCHTIHYCYTQGWLVLYIPDGETNIVTSNWWLNSNQIASVVVNLSTPSLCLYYTHSPPLGEEL